MDDRRFDAFARTLSHPRSRRQILRSLAGAATGLFGWNAVDAAKCAKEGQKPKDKKPCCSGAAGSDGRCAPSVGLACAAECDPAANLCGAACPSCIVIEAGSPARCSPAGGLACLAECEFFDDHCLAPCTCIQFGCGPDAPPDCIQSFCVDESELPQ